MNTPAAFCRLACLAALAVICLVAALPAQTPPPPAKRLPPAGIQISDTARAELTAGAAALEKEIQDLEHHLANPTRAEWAALLPDVQVFHKAVDWALRYDEFFDLKHVDTARQLLASGKKRAAQLRSGSAPWTEATGTVIRGYRSKLDGSVQPYALTVPATWKKSETQARRLDVFLLGRGEKRTELAFILERDRPGRDTEIVPAEAFILTPYGRFCNATKFAGEVDVMEAMQHMQRAYRVDPLRRVVRGFSMGGASTWHLAVHYPHLWAAAGPGAGFAETAIYAKVNGPGKPERTPWEQTLWRWYDATGYAANLFNFTTVAYSGEIDPQKQAADVMTKAMAAEGLKLEHHIGPNTAHKFHPETKNVVAARLDEVTAKGREPYSAEENFTTYTLRYPGSDRIHIREMEKQWERADVRVRFTQPAEVDVKTRNIAVFSLTLDQPRPLAATVDEQRLTSAKAEKIHWLVKASGQWALADEASVNARSASHPRKTPGLTGPINDAFMEPFLFVRPTGKPLNAAVGTWVENELTRATKLWRDLFRGHVVIKDDRDVTAADLANCNLVLWGDSSSNQVIARLLATKKIPLSWDAKNLTFRDQRYDAAHHAPVLIFPNPLSSQARYVVLNSGMDFRDEAYGTNSLQTPKLPDFAIIDLREAPGPRWPGKIVSAGFFDEGWR